MFAIRSKRNCERILGEAGVNRFRFRDTIRVLKIRHTYASVAYFELQNTAGRSNHEDSRTRMRMTSD
jgi:hypothetical protein